MPWVLHTVVGLAAVGLLGAAAWRLAGRTTPGGPQAPARRILAAAVWWWLGAQLSALATALPLPGGTALLGTIAAAVVGGLVLWRVPAAGAPREPVERDPGARADRALLVGVGVLVAAISLLVLRRPVVGFDGLLYHLALPAAWAPQDHLAGLPHVIDGLPVEAYPVGMEVVVGWLVAVCGSTGAGLLVSPVALGLLVLALWTGARVMGAGPVAAAGAVATVALSLPALSQGAQVASDVAATALATAGVVLALAAGRALRPAGEAPAADPGPRRPHAVDGLLVGAVGTFLAVGMKTTTACMVLVVLVLAWRSRAALLARLRPAAARVPWGAALLLGLGLGGAWLARNTILHGHPSWPLLATSFGDPVPPLIERVDGRFIDDPFGALRTGGDAYLRLAWAFVPALIAGLVLLVRGRGVVRVAAACGIVGALAWTVAPATGITGAEGIEQGAVAAGVAAGATRYLLACWALLAIVGWAAASGLADRPSAPAARRRAAIGLAVAAGAALVAQLALAIDAAAADAPPLEGLPLRQTLVALAVAGAAGVAWFALPRLGDALARLTSRIGARGAVAAVALVAAVVVLAATPGVPGRHAAAVHTQRVDVPDEPIVALGGTPVLALGAYGKPGARLASSCADVVRARARGRTIALGPSGDAARCVVPGPPTAVVDGFRVYAPAS